MRSSPALAYRVGCPVHCMSIFHLKGGVTRTVNGQVVRVVVGGAAGHELFSGGSGQIDRVVAKEAVHVAGVFPGLDNGVDVLAHDVPRVDQGIRLHRTGGGQQESCGEHSGGKDCSW